MATPFALPAVTHVIRRLLLDAAPTDAATVLADAGGWQVSTVAPDLVKRGEKDAPLLNLFLYHVAPNRGWRNQDARTHDAAGNRMAAPPLALDLHYLLTAYGTTDYQAEILLGHAMLALHDHPVLSRDRIADAFDPNDTIEALMAASQLEAQVESISLTMQAPGTEGMERLWNGLQLALRPSVSYLATVLLLSSRAEAVSAPPVRRRAIATVPLERPLIRAAGPAGDASDPIEPGATIAITGARLIGDSTVVTIGAADVTGTIDRDAAGYPDRLVLTLPDPLPAGLLPGIRGVRIRHGVTFPGEDASRPLIESNIATLSIRPLVKRVTRKAGPSGARGLTVTFAHEIGDRQSVAIVLDRLVDGEPDGPGLVFPVPDGNHDTPPPHDAPRGDRTKLWVPISAPAGTYAVGATVDGLAAAPRLPAKAVKVTLP